jgi:hypothetical protein
MYLSNFDINIIKYSLKDSATMINNKEESNTTNSSSLSGLSCTEYGGPTNDLAQEMVYWKDIPTDGYVVKYMTYS